MKKRTGFGAFLYIAEQDCLYENFILWALPWRSRAHPMQQEIPNNAHIT